MGQHRTRYRYLINGSVVTGKADALSQLGVSTWKFPIVAPIVCGIESRSGSNAADLERRADTAESFFVILQRTEGAEDMNTPHCYRRHETHIRS